MEYAGYVITGWVLTGAVLALYWYRLVVRTRQARRVMNVEIDGLAARSRGEPAPAAGDLMNQVDADQIAR
jgi:hypothetical protein